MAEKDTLFRETTEIPIERTAGDITGLLVKKGARQISIDYDDAGQATGLHFALVIEKFPLPFFYSINVRADHIFSILNARRRNSSNQYRGPAYDAKDREQAKRIAWRQIYAWIQAQLALVDTGIARTEQVFFPFMKLEKDAAQTVFEYFETTGLKQLAAAHTEKKTA